MIGVNAHEFSLFLPRTYAANEDGMPGEKEYNQALTYYADDEDGARSLGALLSTETDLFRRMERLSSTGYFLCPSNAAARKLARSGHDVYFYYFTRVREGQQQWMGAHHAAELPYIFDTGNRVFPSNATDIALTEAMGDYWANFMASGDPNGKGLAQWPVFKPDTGQYMNLGDEFLVGENLESELCGVMPNAY
jgi:para-nitrobenzyl esterase